MKRHLIRIVLLCILAAIGLFFISQNIAHASSQTLLPAQAAPTAGPTPSDDQVNAVAKQLYCPVCENIPLDVCPTQACAQWRDLIRQKLAAGWSADQIKQYFAAQYGDRVLSQPPLQGPNRWFNTLFYGLIGLSILGGIYVVSRVLIRMSNRRRVVQPEAPSVDATAVPDPYMRRIEEDLRRRR